MNNIVIEVSPMYYDSFNPPKLATINEEPSYYDIEVLEYKTNNVVSLGDYETMGFQQYLATLEELLIVYPNAIIKDKSNADVIMMGIDK